MCIRDRAYTEKKEFKHTYGLDTVVIPTNKPVIRVDRPDVIYITKEGKYKGVVEEVKKTHAKGQPVLIGTASVRTSDCLLYTSWDCRTYILIFPDWQKAALEIPQKISAIYLILLRKISVW